MAELGLLGDHQGDEEPALRCRAPPEGWGEPKGAPGGLSGTKEPRECPPGGDSGSMARQGADVASFSGGGGGAPHHACRCQQLVPPGFAQRPHPLALPPAEPATAAAPAPTQATTQVTTAPRRPRRWGRGGRKGTVPREAPAGGAGPPDPHPPHRTAWRRGERHLQWEGAGAQRARGEAHRPAAR